MGLIDSMYRPTHVLLPIGGKCTMGPYEAAIACKKFLTTCHTVIPMHFSSGETESRVVLPSLESSGFSEASTEQKVKGLMAQFREELERQGVCDKRLVNSETEVLGKWLDLIV